MSTLCHELFPPHSASSTAECLTCQEVTCAGESYYVIRPFTVIDRFVTPRAEAQMLCPQVVQLPSVGTTLVDFGARTTLTITPTTRTVTGASQCQVATLSRWCFPTSTHSSSSTIWGFTTALLLRVPCWWYSGVTCLLPAESYRRAPRSGSTSSRMMTLQGQDSRLRSQQWTVHSRVSRHDMPIRSRASVWMSRETIKFAIILPLPHMITLHGEKFEAALRVVNSDISGKSPYMDAIVPLIIPVRQHIPGNPNFVEQAHSKGNARPVYMKKCSPHYRNTAARNH